jgi:Ser/Thr protein kinase RdoA (MazF antagonist)
MQHLTNTFISDNWSLDNAKIEVILQQSGERIVYKVSSDQGEYVFKLAASSKTQSQLENDTAIFSYLETNDFPAPKLLNTIRDERFTRYNNQFLYAITFIEGKPPITSEKNYHELGKLTARLHLLKDYPTTTGFTAATVIPEMVEKNKIYPIGQKYKNALKSLPDFSHFPTSLIHTDIGLNNSIQRPNGQIVLIDWDDTGIGTRILDIGFPLICSFVTNDVFDYKNAKAYYAAYFENIELTQQERDHIFDAGLFYILMYSIFDGTGIDTKNWNKAQFAIKNKNMINSILL